MLLIDAHCHFMDLKNPKEAVQNALQNGVIGIVSNGLDEKTNRLNQELAGQFPTIMACYGLHPKECLEQTEAKNKKTIEWTEKQFEAGDNANVGEIGLDFLLAKTIEQQKRQQFWFEKQLELAKRFEKAVSIHSRESLDKTIALVQKNGNEKALFHWFDGNEKELKTICENGFFVSIGPAVLTQKKIQTIAKQVSLENLLLETDSPVRFNGKPAEPAWIRMVGEKISELRQEPLETIAQETTKNAEQLFNTKIDF
jgi:TatD DNase family protein